MRLHREHYHLSEPFSIPKQQDIPQTETQESITIGDISSESSPATTSSSAAGSSPSRQLHTVRFPIQTYFVFLVKLKKISLLSVPDFDTLHVSVRVISPI
jgi:hypothetical protein